MIKEYRYIVLWRKKPSNVIIEVVMFYAKEIFLLYTTIHR